VCKSPLYEVSSVTPVRQERVYYSWAKETLSTPARQIDLGPVECLVSPWPGTILVVCAEDSIGQKMAAQTFIYLIWHTNIRARSTSRFTLFTAKEITPPEPFQILETCRVDMHRNHRLTAVQYQQSSDIPVAASHQRKQMPVTRQPAVHDDHAGRTPVIL
jgi:hypothetical protein